MGDDDAVDEALVAARRVYDQQVDELASIDDTALRTLRTDVLILGFVAAALTAGGPDAVGDIHWIPVTVGSMSALALFVSAMLCVGAYLITDIPLEVQSQELRAARHISGDAWEKATIPRMSGAIADVEAEIGRNGDLIALALLLLLFGSLGLAYVSGIAIAAQSYGVSPLDLGVATAGLASSFVIWVLANLFVLD